MKPWDGIISEEEQKAYYAAGFGRPSGIGKRPALLIIDVQYRTIGTTPEADSGRRSRSSRPRAATSAGTRCATSPLLLAEFRRNDWPVLYPHVAPKNKATDGGRLAEKVPAIMDIAGEGLRVPGRDRAARRRRAAFRRSIRARSSPRRSPAT